jgi:hypothetical protein
VLRLLILIALVPALAACEGGGADAPGGVSPGEAEALEDAADMLDERRLPPEALPPEATPTGAAPARSGQ